MLFACGLSNYSVSLFHLVNHGFFVWQHRYFNLLDGFSLRGLIQDLKLTYFLSKLEAAWNKKGEHKWTLVKTPLSWLKFSTLYGKIPQEKGIEKPHFMSWWGIESTLFLLVRFYLNWAIVKILKVGKPVKILLLEFLLIWLFLEISFKQLIQYGCRIVTKLIAPSNVGDRFFWIISWESWIDYSCLIILSNFLIKPQYMLHINHKPFIDQQYKKVKSRSFNQPNKPLVLITRSYHKNISPNKDTLETKNLCRIHHLNLFKKEIKFIFKSYRNVELIFQDLQTILWRYLNLMENSQQVMRKLDNIIHVNSWLWIKKKHAKINKKDLYNKYFQGQEKSCHFNLIKSRYIISGVITRGKHTINKYHNSFPQDFFLLWKSLKINDNLLWSNIEINIQKISDQLKGKSGIYIFWLTDHKQNCYVGSGVDLSRIIKTHYRNALINNKHPKFYNAVRKYGWSNFSLQIFDFVPRSHLIIREQYWLTLLKKSNSWKESYNFLEKANSWEGYSHTFESKIKISQSKKGKSLTPEHI
jgi:hypothetical protein